MGKWTALSLDLGVIWDTLVSIISDLVDRGNGDVFFLSERLLLGKRICFRIINDQLLNDICNMTPSCMASERTKVKKNIAKIAKITKKKVRNFRTFFFPSIECHNHGQKFPKTYGKNVINIF